MSTASQEDMIGRVRLSNNYKIKDSYNTLDYKDDNDAVIKDANDPTKHYKVWATGGATGFRPVIFKPNGSFAVLKAQGKLSLGPQETNAETKDRDYYSQRPHFIPGYTGHIRGKCHLAGRSFGEATHRALVRDYRELACTSPIPSDPSQTRHIPQVTSTHTFVGSQQIGQSLAHVPGYSGYVPRSRESLGVTFGALSRAQLRSANATQDRELLDIEVKDKCRPLFRRQMQKLDSAPLPGGVQTWNAPQKLVPAHLHHVRYLAN